METYKIEKTDYGVYVQLPLSERESGVFDVPKMARTLNISEKDAECILSRGKTYVFAKRLDTGEMIEIYHPNVDLNGMCITLHEVSQERFKKFMATRERWTSAPYADLVGQTENSNHFVC